MNLNSTKMASTGFIIMIKNNMINHLKYIYPLYYISFILKNIDHYMSTLSKYSKTINSISTYPSTTGTLFYFKTHKATKIENISLNKTKSSYSTLSSISTNNLGSYIINIKKTLS